MSSRRWLEIVVPLLAGAVYLATASPNVLGGDCGEFATLLATGGVAHPPGFPLYVMALRAFRFVPAASPAHAAALLSAVTATATAYVVLRAARLYGASVAAAAMAAAMFAAAAIPWKLATHAEVFSQSALLAAVVLLVSAPAFPVTGVRRAACLGLVAGLAISTHLALVFLAPIGLYAFVRALKEEPRPLLAVLAAATGLVFGLSPYAFIVYSARTADLEHQWVWGHPIDFASLVHHFRRADYGSLSLSATGAPSEPVVHLRFFAGTVIPEFLGLPLVAVLGGVVATARLVRARGSLLRAPREHAAVLALVATVFTMGVCFIGMFNRSLAGVGPLIVERFYVLPMVPLTVLGALAFDVLVPVVLERLIGLVLPFVALVSGFLLSADSVREYTRPTLQYYIDNVLAYVPERTVIFGSGDHVVAGFLYGLRGQRQRPDVTFVTPALLDADWYREAANREVGIPFPENAGPDALDRWLDALLGSGRVVMLAGPLQGIERRFPTYPEGPLVHVMPRGSRPPPPDALEALNAAVYQQFRIEGVPPARNTWGGVVHGYYAETWSAISGAFAANGHVEEARRCRARATELAPWFADTRPR